MFPTITWDMANPEQVGMERTANLLQQWLQNKRERTMQEYLPQTLNEQLQQLRYNTQILAPQAEMAPQITAADLLKSQNQANLIGQQAQWYGPQAQSEIGLRGAQASLAGMQTRYMPLNEATKAAQVLNSSSRFGAAFQLNKALQGMPSQAARNKWIADNSEAYTQMMNDLGNKQLQNEATIGQQVLTQQLQSLFPQVSTQPQGRATPIGQIPPQAIQKVMQQRRPEVIGNVQQSSVPAQAIQQALQQRQQQPAVIPQAQNQGRQVQLSQQALNTINQGLQANQSQQQQIPQQQPGEQLAPQVLSSTPEVDQALQNYQQQAPAKPTFGTDKEQGEKFKDTLLYNANLNLIDSLQKKRLNSAVTFEKWMDDQKANIPKMKAAIQYAGLLGKGKQERDEWLNKNPDAIAAFDWYNTDFVTNASNQLKMMEQVGATDQQRQEMHAMMDVITNIKSNPMRAEAAINNFIDMMRSISRSVISGSEPVNKGITRKIFELPDERGNYLDYMPPKNQSAEAHPLLGEYTNEDLEHTAKIHNMTVEQLKKQLGIQ